MALSNPMDYVLGGMGAAAKGITDVGGMYQQEKMANAPIDPRAMKVIEKYFEEVKAGRMPREEAVVRAKLELEGSPGGAPGGAPGGQQPPLGPPGYSPPSIDPAQIRGAPMPGPVQPQAPAPDYGVAMPYGLSGATPEVTGRPDIPLPAQVPTPYPAMRPTPGARMNPTGPATGGLSGASEPPMTQRGLDQFAQAANAVRAAQPAHGLTFEQREALKRMEAEAAQTRINTQEEGRTARATDRNAETAAERRRKSAEDLRRQQRFQDNAANRAHELDKRISAANSRFNTRMTSQDNTKFINTERQYVADLRKELIAAQKAFSETGNKVVQAQMEDIEAKLVYYERVLDAAIRAQGGRQNTPAPGEHGPVGQYQTPGTGGASSSRETEANFSRGPSNPQAGTRITLNNKVYSFQNGVWTEE
jgi:hypothetical protein